MSLLSWFRPASVARGLSSQLEKQNAPDDGDAQLNAGELSVLISVGDTLAARDATGARALTSKQQRVVTAAHASITARSRARTAIADPRWANSAPTEGERPPSVPAPPGFREAFDPHQPLIADRMLLTFEIIFVFVEFLFWYGRLSGDIATSSAFDPQRISDILLSIIIPLSGIAAARLLGGPLHRVVSGYRPIGRKEYLGSAAGVIVAILAVAAVWRLVHWRFDDATSAIGAPSLPATAITLVFVVVLLGDMLARVFLVSEIRTQTVRWLRHLGKLETAVTRANKAHAHAWLDLRSAVQIRLDACERIVATGARVISDDRWRLRRPIPPLADTPHRVRAAHIPAPVGAPARMGVPSAEQLALFGIPLSLGNPLRLTEDAVNTLQAWLPDGREDLERAMASTRDQLYRLAAAPPAVPVLPATASWHILAAPDPRHEPRNGSAPPDDLNVAAGGPA